MEYPDGWVGLSVAAASALPEAMASMAGARFRTEQISGREAIVATNENVRGDLLADTVSGAEVLIDPNHQLGCVGHLITSQSFSNHNTPLKGPPIQFSHPAYDRRHVRLSMTGT